MIILQTQTFVKQTKKLHKNKITEPENAIQAIVKEPSIDEMKNRLKVIPMKKYFLLISFFISLITFSQTNAMLEKTKKALHPIESLFTPQITAAEIAELGLEGQALIEHMEANKDKFPTPFQQAKAAVFKKAISTQTWCIKHKKSLAIISIITTVIVTYMLYPDAMPFQIVKTFLGKAFMILKDLATDPIFIGLAIVISHLINQSIKDEATQRRKLLKNQKKNCPP